MAPNRRIGERRATTRCPLQGERQTRSHGSGTESPHHLARCSWLGPETLRLIVLRQSSGAVAYRTVPGRGDASYVADPWALSRFAGALRVGGEDCLGPNSWLIAYRRDFAGGDDFQQTGPETLSRIAEGEEVRRGLGPIPRPCRISQRMRGR